MPRERMQSHRHGHEHGQACDGSRARCRCTRASALFNLFEGARERLRQLFVLLRDLEPAIRTTAWAQLRRAPQPRRAPQLHRAQLINWLAPPNLSCPLASVPRGSAVAHMSFSLDISFFFISATSSLSERIKSRLLWVMSLSADRGETRGRPARPASAWCACVVRHRPPLQGAHSNF